MGPDAVDADETSIRRMSWRVLRPMGHLPTDDRRGGFAYVESGTGPLGSRARNASRRVSMEAETETKVIDRESTSEAAPDRPAEPLVVVPRLAEPSSVDTIAGRAREPSQAEAIGARPVEPLSVGKKVGRYKLLHRLGKGGMAAVYLGRATGHAGFEKLAAVKVIHPTLAAEPEFVEMFLDEARIAARLQHPHIVAIHDQGEADGNFYMVMEYVEGETLAGLLRQLRQGKEFLPLTAVLQIIADACGGLAAAHELTHPDGRPMHLVHRDVSPHNLLVAMDGRVKVVDFGIAKATGRRSTTRTGQLRGKLAYMSPEQACGETIDHRTDLFAVGAVLWELLTNKRLFSGETESETLGRVSTCKIPDLREHRDDLPAGVIEFVERALARDPDARFASAREMLRGARSLLREASGEQEPREELAAVMKRLFQSRIEYVRATVRRASESQDGANGLASSADSDATRHTARSASGSNPSHTTGAVPIAAASANTGVQTLTTSLATAPARHWSLWLLLPLVGAVAGAAMVTGVFSNSNTDNTDARAATEQPQQRPSLSQADMEPRPAQPLATTVTWQFDIEPKGATLELDGKVHTETTIEVPRGDEPIEVRISAPGYRPRVLHPKPVTPHYIHQRLEPLPPPAPEKTATSPQTHAGGKGTWLRARPKKPKTPTKPATEDTTDKGSDDGGDNRRPAPTPDWKSGLDEPRHP